MSGGRALAEDRMGPLGHVLDLDTRHGAIMALKAPNCNRCEWVAPLPAEILAWQVPAHSADVHRMVGREARCSPVKIELSGISSGKQRPGRLACHLMPAPES